MRMIPSLTPSQVREAFDWCADVFADFPADATVAEVMRAVHRSYEGGLEQFAADCGGAS